MPAPQRKTLAEGKTKHNLLDTFKHKRKHDGKSGLGSSKFNLGNSDDQKRFLSAVTKLQRAYRLASFVYRHFGPELFVDSRGYSASAPTFISTTLPPPPPPPPPTPAAPPRRSHAHSPTNCSSCTRS